MTDDAHRILLVFTYHLDDEAALQKDIQHYQRIMHRKATLELALPEYFILLVSPHIAAHVQRTPEIQAYVRKNTEEGLKRLGHIGTTLGVPPERQCFTEGNRNWEAWRVARALGIDEVYGYSKGFVRWLRLWRAVRSRWKRWVNKWTFLSLFLRRKPHSI